MDTFCSCRSLKKINMFLVMHHPKRVPDRRDPGITVGGQEAVIHFNEDHVSEHDEFISIQKFGNHHSYPDFFNTSEPSRSEVLTSSYALIKMLPMFHQV